MLSIYHNCYQFMPMTVCVNLVLLIFGVRRLVLPQRQVRGRCLLFFAITATPSAHAGDHGSADCACASCRPRRPASSVRVGSTAAFCSQVSCAESRWYIRGGLGVVVAQVCVRASVWVCGVIAKSGDPVLGGLASSTKVQVTALCLSSECALEEEHELDCLLATADTLGSCLAGLHNRQIVGNGIKYHMMHRT